LAVVETSPDNFQAWLNHGQVLDTAASTLAAKALAEQIRDDPSSADWQNSGRLAGFTNPKRERRLPSGMRPFGGCVRLLDRFSRRRPSSFKPKGHQPAGTPMAATACLPYFEGD
jgi:hypothetical protein